MTKVQSITITRKQAEDMIKLIEKNTSISKGVVTNFLQTRLDENMVNRIHREDAQFIREASIDWPNSDRI